MTQDLTELKNQLEQASKLIKADVDIQKQEISTEEKFMKSIGGYVHHKKYENIKRYLSITTAEDTRINCLLLKGEQGLGKSTIIKSIFKEMKKEICYINSYTTALSFYKTLYNNRRKNIILDDTFGLYDDEKGIAILRAVTNTEKTRFVKYDSTSEKLDVPSSFIFQGSITILTNEITEKMDSSLLDRALYRELKFTLQEKIDFMDSIIRFNYKDLKENQIAEIVKTIKENVDETTESLSFRTAIKITEFYISYNQNWEELAIEELKKDEELIYIKELIKLPIDVRNKEWYDNTGKSVRTLQRRMKEMSNRKQYDINTKDLKAQNG